MVVHDSREAVFREGRAAGGEEGAALAGGEDFFGDFEVKRVGDALPDLLGAARGVVLEALEVEDEDGWEGFDEDLLGGGGAAAGGVEIAGDGFGPGEVFEGVGDGVDLGSANVELEGFVGFQGDGVFEAWDAEFGTEFASEDFGNGCRNGWRA